MTALKVVLNMIVKNEEANLERNFQSVKNLVDAIVLLDTGSTDHTIQVAKSLAKKLSLPIHIEEEPFVNFGVSRTRAQHIATEWVRSQEWPLDKTWCLFLDADAELIEQYDPSLGAIEKQPELRMDTVRAFRELLAEKSPRSVFQTHVLPHTSQGRMGIVRMDHAWECKNACHEQWDGPVENPGQNAPWKVFEKPTGGNKPTKLQREVDLLREDIEVHKNRTARNLFQQGRALDSINEKDQALKILEECCAVTKWDEERYEAKLIIGRIWALRHEEDRKLVEENTKKLKEIAEEPEKLAAFVRAEPKWPYAYETTIATYWSAFDACPMRAEALFQTAQHHRMRREFQAACNAIRTALESCELPKTQKDGLDHRWLCFVSSLFGFSGPWIISATKRKSSLFQNWDILHDKLLEELSLSAFYMKDPEWRLRGHRACEFLLENARTEASRKNAERTLTFQNGTAPEVKAALEAQKETEKLERKHGRNQQTKGWPTSRFSLKSMTQCMNYPKICFSNMPCGANL